MINTNVMVYRIAAGIVVPVHNVVSWCWLQQGNTCAFGD